MLFNKETGMGGNLDMTERVGRGKGSWEIGRNGLAAEMLLGNLLDYELFYDTHECALLIYFQFQSQSQGILHSELHLFCQFSV